MEDFWNPSFDIERRADGSILMAQKDALPPHLPTLPASLRRWAGERADQTWLAERRAIGAAGWREVSYAQGLAAVREIGAGLLALGLGPDRPLLILSENSVDHALMGMAAMYAGVPYAPLSTAYSLVSTDHGKLRESLTEGVDEARKTMEDLAQAGISMKDVTDRLLEEGVILFAEAFDKLLDAVEKAR